MKDTVEENRTIHRLVRWAERQKPIRAMLLYSSRVNPDAPVDIFSDYDILLAVTDVRRFHENDRWLEDFGQVLVVFRNPIGLEHGFESFGFITHYEDGTKIDYGFFPVEFLHWVAKQPRLPDDLDNGYVVLLDKDHLTITLFRKVAIKVGDHLGYAYLYDLDRRVMGYLRKVKNLDQRAETL